MAPKRVLQRRFSKKVASLPSLASFQVTLLALLTRQGKGHMTDVAILDVLEKVALLRLFETKNCT